MDNAPGSNSGEYWVNDENPRRSNLLIGYNPITHLRNDHPTPLISTYDDMFHMKVWIRTGVPLQGIAPQTNNEGDLLCPGSIINFDKRPPVFLSDSILIFYLRVHGVAKIFTSRKDILDTIKRLINLSEPRRPLPMKLRRGGGGYVAFERLSPRSNSVDWKIKDDALTEIRNNVPLIDDNTFTAMFGKRNNSRKRVLLHLQSGSFDVNNLKITYGLKDNLDDNDHKLLVITAISAPSQRLSKGDMYSVTNALKKVGNGPYKFLPAPSSRCVCPA